MIVQIDSSSIVPLLNTLWLNATTTVHYLAVKVGVASLPPPPPEPVKWFQHMTFISQDCTLILANGICLTVAFMLFQRLIYTKIDTAVKIARCVETVSYKPCDITVDQLDKIREDVTEVRRMAMEARERKLKLLEMVKQDNEERDDSKDEGGVAMESEIGWDIIDENLESDSESGI
ncbi:MAG: hypothetical protein M1834_005128 [Cirrosporium novae-zelandiae]|nr:MAG: hypothetical protein M1834_005128 [Cirrosporium novae-zelandiae]